MSLSFANPTHQKKRRGILKRAQNRLLPSAVFKSLFLKTYPVFLKTQQDCRTLLFSKKKYTLESLVFQYWQILRTAILFLDNALISINN